MRVCPLLNSDPHPPPLRGSSLSRGRERGSNGRPLRPDHRHDPRRAQGGAAAAARLRRGRAAPGQPQGPRRLRLDGRPARRGDDRRGAAQRAARLGPAGRGSGRDRRQSRQAAVDRRSVGRHHQLPPRRAAFRDLDRGRGEEAGRRGRDQPRFGLPAADRRELLGGEGPRRLAAGRAAAGVGPARPQRQPDRHRHPASWPRRRRALGENLRGGGTAGVGNPPVRLGGARPRVGRRGADGRLLGGGSRRLGHRRRDAPGQGSRRLRHRLSRRPTARSSGANMSPGSAAIHSKLQKLVAGALR